MKRSHVTRPRSLDFRRTFAQRRGVIVVLTGFCLCAIFAFVALSVDTGRMMLTETRMQNAVDAAALAAAQEITAAVYAAGQGQGSANIDANSIAVTAARAMASQVALANGVTLAPAVDVRFGKRTYNYETGQWPIVWDATPYNTVQVVARRTNENVQASDGQLALAFGWAVGRSKVPLRTSATAFVEARDLVVVLDVSASMNDDSSLGSDLGITEAEHLLDGMWDNLRAANPAWPSTSVAKFPATGFGQVNSYAGTYVSSSTTSTILSTLQLTQNDSGGNRKFPYPQPGRNSNGTPKSKPSNSSSDSFWNGYINYVKGLSGSYNKKYGYRTLMDYLQEQRYDPSQSEDLWRTAHYPFHGVKQGASQFMDFLTELDFGDEVGWVAYGQWAVQQKTYYDGEVNIDVTADPITGNYSSIKSMIQRHQAGEYNGWTAMGDAILKARELMVGVDGDPNDDGYIRYGARPTMLVMTDGQTNQKPSGWTLPAGFHWSDWTDYDGNGTADYSTSDTNKQYAFYEATLCINRGITLHTMGVGAGADRDLMRAISFAGGGIYIDVPGGTTAAAMQSQLNDAFRTIGSKVPVPKLVYSPAP